MVECQNETLNRKIIDLPHPMIGQWVAKLFECERKKVTVYDEELYKILQSLFQFYKQQFFILQY